MKVRIKEFDVAMELKNKGMELEIRDTNDNFLGDLVVTKTSLIWCKGKTGRNNGQKMKIEKFIELMEQNGA
ncbi:MAG: hypothetical protein IPM18_09370 [Phycisphaerales bacterium]|nr:hypothetical protein [Phycisphaerales bacterium]